MDTSIEDEIPGEAEAGIVRDYLSTQSFSEVLACDCKTRDESLKKRNEHLDEYVKFLFDKGICVAERLPLRLSAEDEQNLQQGIEYELENP
jgi:hypothetical protein